VDDDVCAVGSSSFRGFACLLQSVIQTKTSKTNFRGNTTIIDPHYHGNYHSYHSITVVPNPMSLFIVETHLQCGGVYNNHIIANCLQSVPVKNF